MRCGFAHIVLLGSVRYEPSRSLRYLLFTSRDVLMSITSELSVGQQFEIERFNRAIDATADPDQLRALAKQLLQAWHTQKAATQWVLTQQDGSLT